MKKLLIFLVIIIVSTFSLQSQVFTVFDVDASNFPLMKASFYLFDDKGNQITDISEEDIEVTENGVARELFSISCPPQMPAIALSSVLVMDASGSMGGLNIHLAKTGAKSFITGLRNNRSETAITVFDEKSHIVSDFSTNKEQLLNAIDKLYYNKYGWTNYNAGLIQGGLNLLQTTFLKKVIIFLSDGKPTTETQMQTILEEAIRLDVKIYSVAIRMSIQKEMREVAEKTGGKWFDNIFDEEKASNIYKEILEDAQGDSEPCTIEWISESVCDPANIAVNIKNLKYNRTANVNYFTPPQAIAKLMIEPFSINFGGIRPNIRKDTVIRVTARNSDFEVTDIRSSNAAFTINPRNFTLEAGESRNVTVSFTPRDSAYTYGEFSVITAKCPEIIYASGGWPGKAPPRPTLKVTHPNGGELFVVGSDTIITWTGITPTDTVSIEYSVDEGQEWKMITAAATGLKYNWRNIPKPPSDKCLVKVTQQSAAGFEEAAIIGGGTSIDGGRKIVKDNSGNLIVVGVFTGNVRISGRNLGTRGGREIFILKYNNNGVNLWARNAGGNRNDNVRDVAVDDAGNIYITGEIEGTAFFGNQQVTSRGGSDVFIAKYDANGVIQWVKISGGIGNDFAGGIAVDRNGLAVIAGSFTGNSSFAFEDIQGLGNYDAFVAAYNPNGALTWIRTGQGQGNIVARDITFDNIGNFIVVGDYSGSATFDNQILSSGGNEDIFAIKYNAAGFLQWAKSIGGAGNDFGLSVSSDGFGSAVIAGTFRGISNFGPQILSSRDYDLYVSKLDIMGNVLWARRGGGDYADAAFDVASDYDGSLAITGYFNDKATFGQSEILSKGGRDIFVARYSATGNFLWVRRAGSEEDCTGYGITFDHNGHIAATGGFRSTADFGTRNYTSAGNEDYFLWRIKYEPIQNDVSDSLFAIVIPQPAARNIDMRQVLVGSVKDSLVEGFIRNLGSYSFRVDSIYFRGADAAAFDLVSGFPKYYVEPLEDMYTEIRFRPLRIGSHNAEIVIHTSSDTLVQTIRGTGIQPQVLVVNPIIDFGQVQVGSLKDSLQAVTIKNIGNSTLYVLSTEHSFPNDVDFSTLAGGGNFQLRAGEEYRMDLRYEANQSGLTSGTLLFNYDGAGSPAIVQLFGEGVDLSPRILSEYQPMKDIICENFSIGKLSLSNAGINPLVVDNIRITGDDAADFSVSFTNPVSIPRDSIQIFDIVFNPKSTGNKSANIQISSNSAINRELLIPISAIKDSSAIVPKNSNIDLGYICPGDFKDTVLTLRNVGTIDGTAEILSSPNFELSDNSLFVSESGEVTINLRLLPISDEGQFTEQIKIVDELCNHEFTVNLTANISSPKFRVDDVIIETFLGQSRDGTIKISNIGVRPLIIENEPVINPLFVFTPGQFPVIINSGNTVDLTVRYTPVDAGEEIANVVFSTSACNVDIPVKITAITSAAGATFELPKVSAFAGETITVPILSKNVTNLTESGVTGIDVRVRFNRTLLAPLNYTAEQIDDEYAEIKIENPAPANDGTWATLRFKTGLGDAESTPLIISNINTIGADANLVKINGEFNLLGICEEGGTRLINPHGTAGIKSISPNPTDGNILVSIELIEKSQTKLAIVNSLGVNLDELIISNQSGQLDVEFDVSQYSSGVYYILLQTPTISEVRKFVKM